MSQVGSEAGVAPRLTEVPLPAWVRDGTGLDRIDYCDSYLVDDIPSVRQTSAEQWAREVLERAPTALRRRLSRGWFVLGLRHGSVRSPQHVLGWPIRQNTTERIVLGAHSRVGMPAELVFAREGDAWLFATLIQHDNRIVSAVWRTIAEPHRRVVRYLLRSAATRVTHA